MKLFLVTLQSMKHNASGPHYGESYVVANDPTEAYELVRSKLDKWDVGFIRERELESVVLVADTARYPDCCTHLHIREENPAFIYTPAHNTPGYPKEG